MSNVIAKSKEERLAELKDFIFTPKVKGSKAKGSGDWEYASMTDEEKKRFNSLDDGDVILTLTDGKVIPLTTISSKDYRVSRGVSGKHKGRELFSVVDEKYASEIGSTKLNGVEYKMSVRTTINFERIA